jgi:hypothetical protein
MNENEPNKPLDTNQENQSEISTQIEGANRALDFSRLTHQNWLFINAFLSTGKVKKAYSLAKYQGTEESAPYQVFRRLKPFIEAIGDLDVTSRARLQADLKPLLDLPLEDSKRSLTLKEFLEVRKFAAKITPEAMQAKPQLSVLVINRAPKEEREQAQTKGEEAKDITSRLDSSQIIDAEEIK